MVWIQGLWDDAGAGGAAAQTPDAKRRHKRNGPSMLGPFDKLVALQGATTKISKISASFEADQRLTTTSTLGQGGQKRHPEV
jgi:hypothetical protein